MSAWGTSSTGWVHVEQSRDQGGVCVETRSVIHKYCMSPASIHHPGRDLWDCSHPLGCSKATLGRGLRPVTEHIDCWKVVPSPYPWHFQARIGKTLASNLGELSVCFQTAWRTVSQMDQWSDSVKGSFLKGTSLLRDGVAGDAASILLRRFGRRLSAMPCCTIVTALLIKNNNSVQASRKSASIFYPSWTCCCFLFSSEHKTKNIRNNHIYLWPLVSISHSLFLDWLAVWKLLFQHNVLNYIALLL